MTNLTGNQPNDERYTPPALIRRVRRVLGAIDCDPASCETAQAIVQAGTWYSREQDGRNLVGVCRFCWATKWRVES